MNGKNGNKYFTIDNASINFSLENEFYELLTINFLTYMESGFRLPLDLEPT